MTKDDRNEKEAGICVNKYEYYYSEEMGNRGGV